MTTHNNAAQAAGPDFVTTELCGIIDVCEGSPTAIVSIERMRLWLSKLRAPVADAQTFEQWWPLESHRRKYPNNHPAYLAAREAWEASAEVLATQLAARSEFADCLPRMTATASPA
ncbi:hypothetical protein CUR95_24195 [Bordetella bronchiseptica]|nr:hypothetical protein [Bordetella bronchiseptica]